MKSRVLELVEERARSRPESPAVESADGVLTRGALWERAGRLAARMTSRGLRPGEVVVVGTGRTAELLVAVLATLRAGGAFCVVDPGYPPSRIRRIHRDSGARFVVAPGLELRPGRPGPPLEGLAYVVFTSGSTGRPKAVGMPHRAVDALIDWTLASTSRRPLRTLQFAPLGFDVFVQEVFTALCSGGALRLPAEEERRDLVRLAELLEAWRIERLFVPPVVLDRLAALAPYTGTVPRSLRQVAVAGEALRITPGLRRFFEELPGCRLHHHYGPSETHVAVAHTLTGPPASWPDLPPIGTPLPGFGARIVDGELWLTGPGVGYGYLNDPAETARRFVPADGSARTTDDSAGTEDSPSGTTDNSARTTDDSARTADDSARTTDNSARTTDNSARTADDSARTADGGRTATAYRTGDLVARDPDGLLRFLGRVDHQVKIRGHLVDPAEVEAVLGGLPGVRECAVTAEQVAGETQLAAHVAGDTAGLRARLAAALPAHLVPARIQAVDRLPLTAHGKVDRARLPAPAGPDAAGDPPTGTVERDVASVWSAVLGHTDIRRDQPFQSLGGTSLSAALVLARLRTRYPARIDLHSFLSAPTVRELARRLTETPDPVGDA
ncbi:AMP-binding protein [Streptomyces sp. NPDC013157]|uniref:non-ribosomal peptide synthetase n=1 Tax=Streptomyces sp. NPDC013157 TaxID=3364861 RepID=UPI0036AFCB43